VVDTKFLEEHALKYYRQFPEIFCPTGTPIDPSLHPKAFEDAVRAYGYRAIQVIKDPSVSIYGFMRDGIVRFLAYNSQTHEIVGFRIRKGRLESYEVAIDTFYKATPDIIHSLKEENLITPLIENGEIVVPYDDYPDSFRMTRISEQEAEFKYFGLKTRMFEEALKKLDETISQHPNSTIVIFIGGVTSAGKSPCTEIITNYLIGHGRTVKILPLDFYFKAREQTPLRDGKPDYDSPAAYERRCYKRTYRPSLKEKK
jgi:hypothetical protein